MTSWCAGAAAGCLGTAAGCVADEPSDDVIVRASSGCVYKGDNHDGVVCGDGGLGV